MKTLRNRTLCLNYYGGRGKYQIAKYFKGQSTKKYGPPIFQLI